MRYLLKILAVITIVLLSSCHKDDPDPLISQLPIHRNFGSEMICLRVSELESFPELDDLYIVNSIEDLPDDPWFSTEEFRRAGIDFSKYSLIIVYNFIFGDILTYKYDWYFEDWCLRYRFDITCDYVRDSEWVDGELERATYIRSAILVNRIPSDSRWIVGLSLFDK